MHEHHCPCGASAQGCGLRTSLASLAAIRRSLVATDLPSSDEASRSCFIRRNCTLCLRRTCMDDDRRAGPRIDTNIRVHMVR
jgi:hypothetical protein